MEFIYPVINPHAFSSSEIVDALSSDSKVGLSLEEVEVRSKKFGSNSYQSKKQKSVFVLLIQQFNSPIIYLLFFAVAVSFYFKNISEALAILVVILINALIGFLMELKARNSMNALKSMDVMHSKVIRNGDLQKIPSELLVPGDLIVFESGDLIPSDAHLIESNQLQCDESSLTGESLPTEKNTDKLLENAVLAEQANMVFKGASVIKGNGKAIVTGISKNTQLGAITSLVEIAVSKETPLDKKIRVLSKKLIWLTLGLTLVFAAISFIQGKSWILILETSIALAVAAFPEGLPIVATVALAYGMLLMARRNAIVKKLSSVETLGSTSVIMTDKTGTLTENKIHVDTFSFAEQSTSVAYSNNLLILENPEIKQSDDLFQKIILIGSLCNNSVTTNTKESTNITGDPIEVALTKLAEICGLSLEEIHSKYKRLDEVPFSSETKFMGTLHSTTEGYFVAAKGSVEHLLDKCNRIQLQQSIIELDEENRTLILNESEKMASNGLRVLAFAYNQSNTIDESDFMGSLIYTGMIGFIDPPRLEVKDSIIACRKAGIKIIMVTGDHPLTALNIARKVGLVEANDVNALNGGDIPSIENLTNDWKEKILQTVIFARTKPKQKLEIVTVFQNAGNIVAMTGDGVNDAPALKKSDIGIAMGLRGTQVAKETADIVLKDDSFSSIALAVSHGREIFQNIQKFVIYLVSCNLSEIFIVTLLGFLFPQSTLFPLQILFLNMVTDIFPALALGLGKGDKTIMNNPPRDPKKLIVSSRDWYEIVLFASVISLAVVSAIYYYIHFYSADELILNNLAFITLAFAQLFHVFNMSSKNAKLIINDITKNKFVWIALVLCISFLAIVFVVPAFRMVLKLAVLPPEVWIISIVSGLLPLVIIQSYKLLVTRIERKVKS